MPSLNWLSRDQDNGAAKRVPYRLFEDVAELSVGDLSAGNMLIQADNLEALKVLLPFYAGQVKCIYIDPPYKIGALCAGDDHTNEKRAIGRLWESCSGGEGPFLVVERVIDGRDALLVSALTPADDRKSEAAA